MCVWLVTEVRICSFIYGLHITRAHKQQPLSLNRSTYQHLTHKHSLHLLYQCRQSNTQRTIPTTTAVLHCYALSFLVVQSVAFCRLSDKADVVLKKNWPRRNKTKRDKRKSTWNGTFYYFYNYYSIKIQCEWDPLLVAFLAQQSSSCRIVSSAIDEQTDDSNDSHKSNKTNSKTDNQTCLKFKTNMISTYPSISQ